MFYIATLAFGIGIGIASTYAIHFSAIIWLLGIAFGIACITLRDKDATHAAILSGLAVGIVFASFGLLRGEWHEQDLLAPSPYAAQVDESVLLSGTVVAEPDERARTTQLQVKTGGDKILVTVDRHHEIAYGDEVVVSGTLKVPEAFETELGRTFDYPGYLLARGITYSISFADIVVISEGNGNPIIAALLHAKQELMTGIESVIEEPQAGLAQGLLLGVKQALGEDIEEAFRKSGIIHIVVLSGYNVMLVVAFFMFFLAPLPRSVKLVLGILAIAGFAFLVGLSATVVRASIMAGLFLLADTFSKNYSVLRMLFFAGAIMIFINPYLLLYDIGFQLSFMATLGLILVTPHFETTMSDGRLPQWREYVLATVATQIAVLPLLLYHIGEISLVAVLVNLLVLPVVPLAMLGGFVAGTLALLSQTSGLLIAYPTSVVLSYVILVATWFADLPFATVTLPIFSAALVPLLYLLLGLVYWGLFHRRKETGDMLTDWVIEDEIDVVTKKGAAVSAAPQKETPIFFR